MNFNFDRDWKGAPRTWKVVHALATCELEKEEVLTFAGGKLIGSKAGPLGTYKYLAGTDEVEVTRTDLTTFKVVRKVCLFLPEGSGTGASWVAEEGG